MPDLRPQECRRARREWAVHEIVGLMRLHKISLAEIRRLKETHFVTRGRVVDLPLPSWVTGVNH